MGINPLRMLRLPLLSPPVCWPTAVQRVGVFGSITAELLDFAESCADNVSGLFRLRLSRAMLWPRPCHAQEGCFRGTSGGEHAVLGLLAGKSMVLWADPCDVSLQAAMSG